MNVLETPEEKKSFAITSAIFVIIALICIFFGLTYMDPPPENGIAVNFGTSDVGQGEIQPTEPVQASAPQTPSKPLESQENLSTQDDDSPVVAPKKEKVKPTPKTTPTETKPTTNTKPVEPTKPTNSVLDGMIKGKDKGTTTGGHGNDGEPGDKGNINGDLYANSFWGNGKGTGSGNGTKWGLAGRSLSGNDKVVQQCNEEGTIVVQVTVNKQGRVISAQYSAKGSNSTSQCLIQPAIATAKTFKWNQAPDAPDTQIGFVEINFRVGE